jgi:hypothetical protein
MMTSSVRNKSLLRFVMLTELIFLMSGWVLHTGQIQSTHHMFWGQGHCMKQCTENWRLLLPFLDVYMNLLHKCLWGFKSIHSYIASIKKDVYASSCHPCSKAWHSLLNYCHTTAKTQEVWLASFTDCYCLPYNFFIAIKNVMPCFVRAVPAWVVINTRCLCGLFFLNYLCILNST